MNTLSRLALCRSSQIFVLIICAGLPACANSTAPVYDPTRPVEWSFWGGAKQRGEAVDNETLQSGLLQEPGAAPFVSKARGLAIAGNVAAAVGGGLVGWPLGEHLGGATDPHWKLAYAGAGAFALGIGLGLWGVSVFGDAVEAHNTTLGGPKEQGFFLHSSGLGYQW